VADCQGHPWAISRSGHFFGDGMSRAPGPSQRFWVSGVPRLSGSSPKKHHGTSRDGLESFLGTWSTFKVAMPVFCAHSEKLKNHKGDFRVWTQTPAPSWTGR
jgi:hypothetical protein